MMMMMMIMTRQQVHVRYIGLQLAGSDVDPFLKIGVTKAWSHCVGRQCDLKLEELNM